MAASKVLLHIGDDPYILEYISTDISDIAELTSTSTLAEARAHLQDNRYKLALLGLTLPDGSGLKPIRELSTNHPDIPIIIFSSHDVVTSPGSIATAFDKNHFSEASLLATISKLYN